MFNETLCLKLDLTINNKIFKIKGGQVKNFEFELTTYGFEASADFCVSSDNLTDTLFPEFNGSELIEVRLSIEGVINLPSMPPDPLVLKGIVTEKSFQEYVSQDSLETPVWFRRYFIHFKDAAQVLWHQHFPTTLNVDAKMKDVIKAQVVQGISLKMDWDVLEKVRPVICLNLGLNPEDSLNDVSFYDFLMWYVFKENGLFTFDSKSTSYLLSSLKNLVEKEISLIPREIESIKINQPETCRHTVNVLNTCTELPKSEEIKQNYSVSGIRHDLLLCSPIASVFDELKTLETFKIQKQSNRMYELELVLKEFPAKTFRPGIFAKFDVLQWNKTLFTHAKEYRIVEISMKANAKDQNPADNMNVPESKFQIEMKAILEPKINTFSRLPSFKTPLYPVRAEGKIVSESGESTDKTYQVYSDKQTSQDCYTVSVPAWNQNIRILFEPNFNTGHFYFPAFKHARVLIAVYFDKAEIVRVIDWGVDVPLPMDSQGNHILFGKNSTSETSIKYDYKDQKPLFNIKRIAEKDTELIQLEEGSIILQTKEEEVKKTTSQSYNLVPEVEGTRVRLSMENKAAMANMTADFESSKSESNAAITAAISETEASLAAMDDEISDKTSEVESKAKAALRKMAKSTAELETRAKTAAAELKAAAVL